MHLVERKVDYPIPSIQAAASFLEDAFRIMRLFIFVLLFFLPSVSSAQDWSAVQVLPPNTRLRIEVNNSILKGRFRSADDTKITLNRGSIAKLDVRQIERLRSRKADGAARGFLIAFGVHAGLVLARTGSFSYAALAGLGIGGLGALAGVQWGIDHPKRELVYRR
jgi:hypothetical protein